VEKLPQNPKCNRCLGVRIRKGIYSGLCSLCFDDRIKEATAEGVKAHKGVMVRKMTLKEINKSKE
jgi:hypothetical protein